MSVSSDLKQDADTFVLRMLHVNSFEELNNRDLSVFSAARARLIASCLRSLLIKAYRKGIEDSKNSDPILKIH